MNQFIFPYASSMKSGFPWAGDEAELPGTADAPARLVEIPVHPDEEIDPQQGAPEVWSDLRAWADYHRVDTDQALLVCACAAAHAVQRQL
jgi:hypothetical protein